MTTVIVNDLDGNTFHTVTTGSIDSVRAEYAPDHPVQRLISEAIEIGVACDSYEIDGEEYTTKVSARREQYQY